MRALFLSLIVLALFPVPLPGAQHIVTTSGFTFTPSLLTISAGDTVVFSIAGIHNAVEVAEPDWNTNTDTPLPGGFALPFGGGSIVLNDTGTHYYICQEHILVGMKGRIVVNTPAPPPTTITINSLADQDGDHATATDRIGKPWSLKLYQDSVGSGIVVDSAAFGTTLVVAGLGPGVYAAAEADSAPWSHISLVVDGVSQGFTAQTSWTFSVGSGETRSVEFVNHVPNMIINSGFAFFPETLTVDSGETVWFVLEPVHTARQVDSAVWAANDTASNGGFDLPPGGGFELMDQPGDAYYVCVPHGTGGMKGIIRTTVEPYAGTLQDSLDAGWNLLSFPFAIPESAVTALYPDAVSRAYGYAAGFLAYPAVSNGPGYFIKFGGPSAVDFSGLLVETDTIPLAEGWNVVGSVSAPVAVSSLQSIPPGLVMTPFFGYDAAACSEADTIVPGRGYWVKVTGAGSLLVSSAPGAAPSAGRIRIHPTDELPPPPPRDVAEHGGPGSGGAAQSGNPTAFGLRQNYPNPFNPSTRIAYSLDREIRVRVAVYNLTGERIATLVDAVEGPGGKTITFDAAGLPGGVYVVRVLAGNDSRSVKMVLIK